MTGDEIEHYKGGKYTVSGFAKHTETREKLVIYTDKQGNTWARPAGMFNDVIDCKPRFKIIKRYGRK